MLGDTCKRACKHPRLFLNCIESSIIKVLLIKKEILLSSRDTDVQNIIKATVNNLQYRMAKFS